MFNFCRKQIAAVNWERKRSQTASGARLRALRRRWAQLVSDNYRLERAIMQLEIQLEKVHHTYSFLIINATLVLKVVKRQDFYTDKCSDLVQLSVC